MATIDQIKQTIDQEITTNSKNEISGAILNGILNLLAGYLGEEVASLLIEARASYRGFISETGVPESATTDTPIWYLAGPGTYMNLLDEDEDPIVLTENLSAINWDGTKASMLPLPVSIDLSSMTPNGGFTGSTKDLINSLSNANSVVNLGTAFSSNELNALKVIKRITITGVTDYNVKYGISALVGPANTDYPGQIIIVKIAESGNVSNLRTLDLSQAVTTTNLTIDGLQFEIVADWTGFETANIILNESVSENMVIAKVNYRAVPEFALKTELSNYVGLTKSVFNLGNIFTGAEMNALKILRRITVTGVTDYTVKYGIAVLCGPGFAEQPGRIQIIKIADSGNVVAQRVLDTSKAITTTTLTIDGLNFEILADWTGFETAGIILNESVSNNMIIVASNYTASAPVTQTQLSAVQLQVTSLDNNLGKIIDSETTTDWNKNIEGFTSIYGATTITAWGFFIRSVKNLKGVRWNGTVTGVTEVRVIIKENNNFGTVLVDKRTAVNSDISVLFDNPIADGTKKLFCIFAFDGTARILQGSDPATIFNAANGYSGSLYSISADAIDTGTVGIGNSTRDFQVELLYDVEHVSIKQDVLPSLSVETIDQIKRNLKFALVGTSVTWGEGFLQDSMVGELMPLLQIKRTNYVGLDGLTGGTILNSPNDRMFFDKKAYKIEGIDSSIEFDITGDEISIVQGILRSNDAASEIKIYIDGVLYDTINNFNTDPIGHETKSFTAVAGQKEFRLLKPFTYNHVVKVNDVEQVVTLNKGTTMPAEGWAVARDIQLVDGKYIVQHTLFSPTALNEGDEVTCEFDYGHEIVYEKTTIGKDGNGIIESTYGRGVVPFDPANPGSAAFGSGLDFRETDHRVISKYVFTSVKKRHVQLKIKGLDPRATGTGTPYFIFNFATNRILYFQNAGIGGWKSSYFNDPAGSTTSVLRSWREVVDFEPDYLIYESTPNDDWTVGGYKLYTSKTGLSLAELQSIRLMPNKKILYNAGDDTYDYDAWYGYIEAITKESVTFTEETQIGTDPVEGDTVVIGTYFSDNKQYIARRVKSYNAASRTITFDRRISDNDHKLASLDDFIGKRIQVRDLAAYINPTIELLDKFKSYGSNPKIGLVPNPAPNMYSRDLAAYYPLLNDIANERGNAFVGLKNVYDWQFTVPRNKTVTVSATDLIEQPDGTKTLDLTGFPKNNNYTNFAILIGGIDRNNDGAFVKSGYCLGVDRTKSGAALNDTTTRSSAQVWGNFYSTLIFYRDAPVDGDIVITCTDNLWSADMTHVNGNSKTLFALEYAKYID